MTGWHTDRLTDLVTDKKKTDLQTDKQERQIDTRKNKKMINALPDRLSKLYINYILSPLNANFHAFYGQGFTYVATMNLGLIGCFHVDLLYCPFHNQFLKTFCFNFIFLFNFLSIAHNLSWVSTTEKLYEDKMPYPSINPSE